VATQYSPARCRLRRTLRPSCSPSLTPAAPSAPCLPIDVGAMNINELMNINNICESATIFPRPCKLTFDLLTLKVVSESHVTWATYLCANFGLSRPVSVLELFPMYATDRHTSDRQTDVRQKHRLMPRLLGAGA